MESNHSADDADGARGASSVHITPQMHGSAHQNNAQGGNEVVNGSINTHQGANGGVVVAGSGKQEESVGAGAVNDGGKQGVHSNDRGDTVAGGAQGGAAPGSGATNGSAGASGGGKQEEPAAVATPLRVRRTDRYGFYVDDSNTSVGTPVSTSSLAAAPPQSGAGAGAGGAIMEQPLRTNVPLTPAKQREKIRLENQRTEKWRPMMRKWGVFTTRKATTLKRRIRKGIPEALRGIVWMKLVGADERMKANPTLYAQMLRADFPTKVDVIETIDRDISRTFPRHAMFARKNGLGQSSLMRVLRAYAAYDQEVGYCQGMGFITAMFLSYVPEEEAFFLLLTMLKYKPHEMAGLFRPGMPMVGLVHYQFHALLHAKLPKLAKHLDDQGIHPTIFASQWFITVFTYSFHFEFSTRVWDCFLNEGWKIAFRVGLGLLKNHQKELLKRDFEGIMTYLRDLPKRVDTEKTLKTGFAMSLKRAEMDVLKANYERERLTTLEMSRAAAAR